MSVVPSKQDTDRSESKATGIVYPDGRFIHFCIGQCTEIVQHRDGSFFCRLYSARRNENDEPLKWCKVKKGLLKPRIHVDEKDKKEATRYGEMEEV